MGAEQDREWPLGLACQSSIQSRLQPGRRLCHRPEHCPPRDQTSTGCQLRRSRQDSHRDHTVRAKIDTVQVAPGAISIVEPSTVTKTTDELEAGGVKVTVNRGRVTPASIDDRAAKTSGCWVNPRSPAGSERRTRRQRHRQPTRRSAHSRRRPNPTDRRSSAARWCSRLRPATGMRIG